MDLPKNRHPYFGPATPSLVDLCIKFDDPRNYKVNFDKIQKELSYQYQFSLEDGIRELYEEIQKGSYKK
jgi:nucleoside-diphosphate-sugar epimerase